MERFDIIIIGAGIAGASAAFEMSRTARVLVLEMEDQVGSHATGRSAAFFSETYGNATIRALTTGSKDFLCTPPVGFNEIPLLLKCGALFIGRADQLAKLDEYFVEVRAQVPNVERCGPERALKSVPILRPEYVAGCVWEPDSHAIDVHELFSSYIRGAKKREATFKTHAGVNGLQYSKGAWMAETPNGNYSAPIVVNAAGAWADQVAELAGLPPLGLTPMRRSVCVLSLPETHDVSKWPLVLDVEENFYFKPDNNQLWLSPADETPMPPCDIYPDDLDIATAVDRFEKATTVKVNHIHHSWAGLRTFAPDHTPVAGFDPNAENFFWLAGQGGYGIQTSPSMARTSAALIKGEDIPDDLKQLAVTKSALAPDRFRSQTRDD